LLSYELSLPFGGVRRLYPFLPTVMGTPLARFNHSNIRIRGAPFAFPPHYGFFTRIELTPIRDLHPFGRSPPSHRPLARSLFAGRCFRIRPFWCNKKLPFVSSLGPLWCADCPTQSFRLQSPLPRLLPFFPPRQRFLTRSPLPIPRRALEKSPSLPAMQVLVYRRCLFS